MKKKRRREDDGTTEIWEILCMIYSSGANRDHVGGEREGRESDR